MARQKRLNIYNTDRYFNIRLMKREDISNKVKVTRLNEDEILKEMNQLEEESSPRIPKRDNKSYIVYQEKYTDDTVVAKILNHAGAVTYYTEGIVPYYTLKSLAKNVTSEAMYQAKKEYSKKEIENIQMSFSACPVVIDLPIVIPDISPYDVLFSLHPLKTNVDRVQISFPWLRKEEVQERHKQYYTWVEDEKEGHYELPALYKYRFFKYIQTSLSIWAMNIWVVCDSDEDTKEMEKLIAKDRGKPYLETKEKGRVK